MFGFFFKLIYLVVVLGVDTKNSKTMEGLIHEEVNTIHIRYYN